jgi:hypothetical protein
MIWFMPDPEQMRVEPAETRVPVLPVPFHPGSLKPGRPANWRRPRAGASCPP